MRITPSEPMAGRAVARVLTVRDDDPDRLTSLADARTALCLARGVAMEDIDPASGHDISRQAFDRYRWQWRDMLQGRDADDRSWAEFNRHEERWRIRRPEFFDDADPSVGGAPCQRGETARV